RCLAAGVGWFTAATHQHCAAGAYSPRPRPLRRTTGGDRHTVLDRRPSSTVDGRHCSASLSCSLSRPLTFVTQPVPQHTGLSPGSRWFDDGGMHFLCCTRVRHAIPCCALRGPKERKQVPLTVSPGRRSNTTQKNKKKKRSYKHNITPLEYMKTIKHTRAGCFEICCTTLTTAFFALSGGSTRRTSTLIVRR
ncbi:hypothetical protein DQ04_07441070, partial [Trypanosoma grayi]|uniref:hypothetical protein n=1 Tax=Trypanosoma grayi TaxID=71804 RepID=UPI0004F42861